MPEVTAEHWTIRSVLQSAEAFLKKQGIAQPRLDTELLLAEVLGLERLQIYLNLDQPLHVPEREAFKVLLRRRAAREPVAYILGWRGFWKHTFKVGPEVLIPRPETEFLLEACLEYAKARSQTGAGLKIFDLATGSGCMALSIGADLPEAAVSGGDISTAALLLANENRQRLKLDRVTFTEFDLFAAANYANLEPVDIVVSNPPYVALPEWRALDVGVRDFEPRLALVAGEDGLDCYRAISEHIQQMLKPGALLMLELGMGQAEAVRDLFEHCGLVFEKIVYDYGSIARVLILKKPLD